MICVQGQACGANAGSKHPSTFEFLPLIADVMRSTKIRQGELSELSGIKQCTLSRYLTGEREMSLSTVFQISDALRIDQLRAYVAVIKLRDWRLYYDDRLRTAIEFHEAVIEECMKLNELSVSLPEIRLLAAQSAQSLSQRKKIINGLKAGETPALFGA